MSVIGPRPQLVRDMVFMTDEQRLRHTAKPGLSGLAQVNGRNAISWEDKLEWDLKYIRNISLAEDIKIILATVKKAFIKQEGITQDDMATAEDFGDYLLRNGKIDEKAYGQKQEQAKKILSGEDEIRRELGLVSIIMPSYNTAAYIKESIQSVLNQTYTNWELIIVDDCSTDSTDEVLETIKDSRIRYFKNDKNSGAAVSRNKALREAKGQWIAFLDSDDLWMPEKLEKQIYFMESKRMLKIVAIKVNWSKQLTMMIALIVQSIVASSGKNFYIQVICMVVIIYKQKDIVKKIFNRLVKKESIK